MQPVASVVPFAIRRLLRVGDMSQGKLDFAWATAVGPAIQRVSQVSLSANGTVEVRVDDPAWRRELKHSQAMILGRLQELLGGETVRAVKILSRPLHRS